LINKFAEKQQLEENESDSEEDPDNPQNKVDNTANSTIALTKIKNQIDDL